MNKNFQKLEENKQHIEKKILKDKQRIIKIQDKKELIYPIF